MKTGRYQNNLSPTILIILGATGDLMARKLVPAIHHLMCKGQVPERFTIVGVSRQTPTDEEFRQWVATSLHQHGGERAGQTFLKTFTYQQGDFHDPQSYDRLGTRLHTIESDWGVCANKLFYLAVPPDRYETILRSLARSKLTEPCSQVTGWTRVLIEKPLGKNLKEAEKINHLLETLFNDIQVYRIDHYLGKQAVQNIMTFRFSNNFLEPAWNRNYIEKIEIKLWEDIDIEGRGAFYDQLGALIDVGQNHMLEMLALVTMDHPIDQSAPIVWQKRQEILDSLEPIKDVDRQTFHAQYKGYRNEDVVRPDSNTETYFRITAYLRHPRWYGVPIVLESGKNMPETDKRIVVTFKHPSPCLCEGNMHYQNQVIFRIQPNPGIAIQFWSRKPGSTTEVQERWLNFEYPVKESMRYLQEYSQLLFEAIRGYQMLFVSGRETVASWRFVDPIVRAWRSPGQSIATYEPQHLIQNLGKAADQFALSPKRQIGMIGLGKMGSNLALRLREKGWPVIGYDPNIQPTTIVTVSSFQDLVSQLPSPRVVWLMVPHDAVDEILFGKSGLVNLLNTGDIIIDGGNSFYKDSMHRAKQLVKKSLAFIDVGVSGGPQGARTGPSLMVGGRKEDVENIKTLFTDLAIEDGYNFFEGHGAGHFVKMIHNGIEYGMMQAIAEGFSILRQSYFKLDVTKVAEVYNHGSVIESRLVDWLLRAFQLHGQDLEGVTGRVADTGEGEWTVKTARALRIKAKIIAEALKFRETSQKNPTYTGKILSALREQFGGHAVTRRRLRNDGSSL